YKRLVNDLRHNDMVILGFRPEEKKQYGLLEIQEGRVCKIIEWKYWRDYSLEAQATLTLCNAGIYAVRKEVLERYLPVLSNRPQRVNKRVNGRMTEIEEYFITDLVEFMVVDGCRVGYVVCADEHEPMGVDDPVSLAWAQKVYAAHLNSA
ncbi:MAG: MobA-like NTP transferase domain containing protein, partial [Desulfatitalea sp.]|nr:MobA-like NTP transferase domain containing protein [Desulfatitalea sp.]NNJ99225.1 MobA-like NTP transferase domain containing protein [Desulfatitalea sp.]